MKKRVFAALLALCLTLSLLSGTMAASTVVTIHDKPSIDKTGESRRTIAAEFSPQKDTEGEAPHQTADTSGSGGDGAMWSLSDETSTIQGMEDMTAGSAFHYTDVNPDDWYYQVVTNMSAQGKINGYPNHTFQPNQSITRIEFAKMLFSYIPVSETLERMPESLKQQIIEIGGSYWGNDIIIDAIERGILTFESDPEEWSKPATRSEAAYMVYRACACTDMELDLSLHAQTGAMIGDYGDCLADPYCPAILMMVSSGIMNGVNKNKDFIPNGNTTRAEACAIISRLVDRSMRTDFSTNNVIHPDAPMFNNYVLYGYDYMTAKQYADPPVNYSALPSVSKGSYTSTIYGGMTQKEALEAEEVVDSFLNNYIRSSMTDLQKVCIAAEYIMNKCNYAGNSDVKPYTAWGALAGNGAWCTGYSYAFKLLCDAMDIECVAVPANQNSLNPSHMWNEVNIDGYWYVLDVQVMDQAREASILMGSDFYMGKDDPNFLVSEEKFKRISGMDWNINQYPICVHNYFEEEDTNSPQ